MKTGLEGVFKSEIFAGLEPGVRNLRDGVWRGELVCIGEPRGRASVSDDTLDFAPLGTDTELRRVGAATRAPPGNISTRIGGRVMVYTHDVQPLVSPPEAQEVLMCS